MPVGCGHDLEPWFARNFVHPMPWPASVAKTVMFIGTRENGRFRPRATAFRVVYEQGGLKFGHLVTAEHVVSGLQSKGHEIWVRANLPGDQETAEFPIDPSLFTASRLLTVPWEPEMRSCVVVWLAVCIETNRDIAGT